MMIIRSGFMKWSNELVYKWMLELAETALDIDENNVEDVEDFLW